MGFPLFLTIIYLWKSGELSSSSGAEWRETEEEDLDLATQLRLLENGDLLLQVEKIKLLGKKTDKGPVSEEEVSIYSSSEARGGIQEGAEGLGWFLCRRKSPPAAWAQTAKSPP